MELLSPPTEAQAQNIDHRVVLHQVSWEGYEAILRLRGDRAGPRIAYLEGEVELMSPSEGHEDLKKKWARLLEAWSEEVGIDLEGRGSWTLKERKEDRGAEPDECYFVGPPKERPDLALEVNWTSGGLPKLEIYRGLGVREVQMWERGRIEVYVLRRGHYVKVRRSQVLPSLDLEFVARHLRIAGQANAVRALRASLRRRRRTH